MVSRIVESRRWPREREYGALLIVVGAILWPLFLWLLYTWVTNPDPRVSAIGRVYVAYGAIFWVGWLISLAAYRAHAFGNMVLLGPDQLPNLHAMVVGIAAELGLDPAPKTFLYNSNGLVNAFARRLLGGRYVFLTSALVDIEDDEQVRFVIGHELGHHAAGHLNPWKNTLRAPARMIPFLYPAYSRAREYTCDRIGAYAQQDLNVSRRALSMLGCGCGRMNAAINCEAFTAQETMVPPVMGFLTEICRSHPRLTRRVRALEGSGARVKS